MGRPLFTCLLDHERQLYAAWLRDPSSSEGREFRAPTTDTFVACARHMVEPGNTQRAVTELPLDTPSSPIMPTFAPINPLPVSHVARQILTNAVGRLGPPTIHIPEITTADPFHPQYLCVPVILVDSVSNNFTQVPRYAILGPHDAGMLWEERRVQLAYGDTHTVVLRRNHGVSPQKPWCSVIEAEYRVGDLTFPRVLLAANFLVNASFTETEAIEQRYTGNGVEASIHDWLSFPFHGPTYGISATNYCRADSPEGYSDTEEDEDNEGGTRYFPNGTINRP
ncbi:hypothetical protein DFH09DRAFT_1081214 [Mycena vulgaris]|nr:hypothetical protein DFH09DRAFT_1081214 [Mycena vulgaris]